MDPTELRNGEYAGVFFLACRREIDNDDSLPYCREINNDVSLRVRLTLTVVLFL